MYQQEEKTYGPTAHTATLPGIVQDPTINSGRPIIAGTRIFVDRIPGHIESGMSPAEICQEYDLLPAQVVAVKHLTPEQAAYVKGVC